jgi:PAS domain S-box-containing protein
MEIGRSLSLFEMLKAALNAYLKKLNCITGIFYRLVPAENSGFSSEMIFSIPYALIAKSTYKEIESLVPSYFSIDELNKYQLSLPMKGRCEDDFFFHLMKLDDFGFMILIRKGSFLNDDITDVLLDVNNKLAMACKSCVKVETLEESELRFRHQQELLPEMLCETNLEGEITYATSYALEKMGYSRADLKSGINIRSLFIGEDHERLQKNFENAFVNDISNSNEYTLITKTGKPFPVLIKTNRLIKNNKVNGLISIIVDISGLKDNEKKIIEMNFMRDKLYSVIAHDIRTPFSSISLTLSALANGYLEPGSDEFKEILKHLEKTANETSILLDNLLEFTRLQSKSLSITPKYLAVYPVLMETIQLLRANAEKKNIGITYDISDDLIAYFDETSVNAVFRNVIFNAIKFTPENGNIDVIAAIDGVYARVTVADTGIGLSEELIRKIFIDNEHYTTPGTNNEQGSGLGSFIIKDFIKKNNGKLEITSKPGSGTKIFVYLPLDESIQF